ncbi:hypothetical protein Tco_1285508 [Tanacetum coccineum]
MVTTSSPCVGDVFSWMTNTQTPPLRLLLSWIPTMCAGYHATQHCGEACRKSPEKFNDTVHAKELWESLERKYKTEDAGTKKFVVARFLDYKMVDFKDQKDNKLAQKDTYAPDSAKGHIGVPSGTCPTTVHQPGHRAANCQDAEAGVISTVRRIMVDENVDMICVNLDAVENGHKLLCNSATDSDIKGEGDVIQNMPSQKKEPQVD